VGSTCSNKNSAGCIKKVKVVAVAAAAAAALVGVRARRFYVFPPALRRPTDHPPPLVLFLFCQIRLLSTA